MTTLSAAEARERLAAIRERPGFRAYEYDTLARDLIATLDAAPNITVEALAEILFEEGIAPFQSRWKLAERILARLTELAPQREYGTLRDRCVHVPLCRTLVEHDERIAQPVVDETERERRRKYAGAFARPPAAPKTEHPTDFLDCETHTTKEAHDRAAPERERLRDDRRWMEHTNDCSRSREGVYSKGCTCVVPAAPETDRERFACRICHAEAPPVISCESCGSLFRDARAAIEAGD